MITIHKLKLIDIYILSRNGNRNNYIRHNLHFKYIENNIERYKKYSLKKWNKLYSKNSLIQPMTKTDGSVIKGVPCVNCFNAAIAFPLFGGIDDTSNKSTFYKTAQQYKTIEFLFSKTSVIDLFCPYCGNHRMLFLFDYTSLRVDEDAIIFKFDYDNNRFSFFDIPKKRIS